MDTSLTWRQTFPWTDEQIIKTCLEEADRMDAAGSSFLATRWRRRAENVQRTGWVPKAVISLALSVLVTSCAVCGKKALYRVGTEGRCREHRLVPEQHAEERRQRYEEASHAYQASRVRFDDLLLKRESLKKVKRSSARRGV